MMADISDNFTKDAWVYKGDIKGFFMSINKNILWNKLEPLIREVFDCDYEWWSWLIKKIVMNRPELNCVIKGKKNDWEYIPPDKTLFKTNGKGIPIGNYTSQVFANLYLTAFDVMVLKKIGNDGGYGRGADDFVIIHKDKEFLKNFKNEIKEWLHINLDLSLHSNKIYFQHINKGVKFLGSFIKNGTVYPSRRAIHNLKMVIREWNMRKTHTEKQVNKFLLRVNSYLGFLRQGKSYNLRKKLLKSINNQENWLINVNNLKIKKK